MRLLRFALPYKGYPVVIDILLTVHHGIDIPP